MKRLLPAKLALLVTGLIQCAGASTIYPIDVTITSSTPTSNPLQSDTVTGNIKTDGTIGALAPANILSWDLNLIDNLKTRTTMNLRRRIRRLSRTPEARSAPARADFRSITAGAANF